MSDTTRKRGRDLEEGDVVRAPITPRRIVRFESYDGPEWLGEARVAHFATGVASMTVPADAVLEVLG